MEITARVTADAEVRTTPSGKKVVGFNIAKNETFKSNGEKKQRAHYFECSYWNNEAIAVYLTKGSLVTLSGMPGARAYVSGNGEPKAVATFRVDRITLEGKGGNASAEGITAEPARTPVYQPSANMDTIPVPVEDLPF